MRSRAAASALSAADMVREGLGVSNALKMLGKEEEGMPAGVPGDKEFPADLGPSLLRAQERAVRGVLWIPGCPAELRGQEPETGWRGGATSTSLMNKEGAFADRTAVVHFSRTLLRKKKGCSSRTLL